MSNHKSTATIKAGGATYGLGTMLAVVLSWSANKAIALAVLHGLLSWFYVIYYLVTREGWTWF